MMISPFDLASTFAVIEPNHAAVPVAVTPSIFGELDRRFDHFKGHLLVSSFGFDASWTTWERHPAGDEIVCLLSGEVMLRIEDSGGETAVRLDRPGVCAIIPRGAWHTADTTVPCRMLFVTPGEGTENRPREGATP